MAVEYHVTVADRIYLVYLHLVFSMVSNLEEWKELGEMREAIKPISRNV